MRDQVGDGAELQRVPLREGDEIGQPRHRAVIVHDLADHTRRVEPGEAREIDRRLGVPGAHQRAALAREQRKHVPRRDDVLAAGFRIDRDRDGARAVMRGDAGRHPLARLDRDGERRLVPRAVRLAHQRQAELLDPLAGEREADQPARMAGHEIHRLRRRELRRDDEIALVLAILVIDEDEHAPGARLLDQLLGGGEVVLQRGGDQVLHRASASRAT